MNREMEEQVNRIDEALDRADVFLREVVMEIKNKPTDMSTNLIGRVATLRTQIDRLRQKTWEEFYRVVWAQLD